PRSAGIEQISKYLKIIIAEQGPMVAEHAYHVYLDKARIKRLGGQIQEKFNQSMKALLEDGDILVVNHSGTNGQLDIVVKTPDQYDVVIREHLKRPIERIPQNELHAVMEKIKDSQLFQDNEQELMRAVLVKYGLKRLTKKTETILNEIIKRLRVI
ncbi:MAG: hypothetical protein WB554_12145, partial [Desulfomonilaceae bacterium]